MRLIDTKGFYVVDKISLCDVVEDGFEWMLCYANLFCSDDIIATLKFFKNKPDTKHYIIAKIPEDKKIWYILKYGDMVPPPHEQIVHNLRNDAEYKLYESTQPRPQDIS